MAGTPTIASVAAAQVQAELPAPVVFGQWAMKHREFVVVRMLSSDGVAGWSFTLTRDGCVAEQVRKSIAGVYVGQPLHELRRLHRTAWRRSLASHASGVGMRALSVVDLAAWDLKARHADHSITEELGGRNQQMPATAIIGYPPGQVGPTEIADQTRHLSEQGWTRFKAPAAATEELTAARLRAARTAAPDAWLGLDAAWVYDDANDAARFVNSLDDVRLGWFEDVLPPGDAAEIRRLRELSDVPIAMGDEQGGAYYPDALLAQHATDVVRIDLTCMGGISAGRSIVDKCLRAGVAFAPHMFAHVHSQVFSAWGYPDVPVEWGVPWTGVDPYADSLAQPTILPGGTMQPLPDGPGFGTLLNHAWLSSQPCDDPDGILRPA